MTQKHFKRIAAILNYRWLRTTAHGKDEAVVEQIAEDLCEYFEEANPRFKRDLFMKVVMTEEDEN